MNVESRPITAAGWAMLHRIADGDTDMLARLIGYFRDPDGLKRKCVTADIDPNAVVEARQRVADTKVGDPLVRPTILTAQMPMEDDDIEFELKSSLSLTA